VKDVAYRVVDVFSERPLAGNALCVVLDPCPEELMPGIAREVNLSETTFPTVTAEGAYRNRIWTPGGELPFAGHPTLGTAWVLGPGRWEQTSAGAVVTVDVDAGGARMQQPVPVFAAQPPDPARAALRLRSSIGTWTADAAGIRHVVTITEGPIDELTVDLDAVKAVTAEAGATTCAVVRRVSDDVLHVRVFVPAMGIPEDPGTGSAAGPIAVLAHEELGTATTVTIRQGDEVGRPCRIGVEVDAAGPYVSGRVSACAEGRFTLGNIIVPRERALSH
jgi:trans-2,3-dihydro-3-hydroxyanthranilate isomerase